jgi:DNA-binding transcriptional ArsR family regulator
VKVLEEAGLIARRRSGRIHYCSLRPEPLAEANRWLKQWEHFWAVRLDRLQSLIESDKKAKENPNG